MKDFNEIGKTKHTEQHPLLTQLISGGTLPSQLSSKIFQS